MAKRQKNSFFQFKRFVVHQDKTAMKVCTDACLLGAVSTFPDPTTMLDIGTGTGLLSLMLAQRFPNASINSIEIDNDAAQQAEENRRNSPYATQIKVSNTSLQVFAQNYIGQFSGIICNPPFYENALKSTDLQKNTAHHQLTLTFEDLAIGIEKLLAPNGVCWILLPPNEMEKLSSIFAAHFIFKSQSITIAHNQNMPIIREICCFEKNTKSIKKENESIFIYNLDGTHTSQFQELLKEFYIIF